ncbi:MAG: type II toxin-antitoxin system VapC family toxin [Spirochaetaceae bacterium]|nr:MAG: type II toxin-antitoxin system VapC family toxin [Spirochaetaceae bacterium]
MEIGVVIDTNRYRDFVDGIPEAVAVFRSAGRICVPFVVVAELRAGFAAGTRSSENERRFEQFLHRPRVEILYSDLATTRHYAQLYRQLRTAGTPIPTNDMWIASLVVQHELPLYSRDAHFDALPQLTRV